MTKRKAGVGMSIFPLARKAGGAPTADLLTQRLSVHEPAAWMLRPRPEA